MMRGIVHAINSKAGMVAIATENDDFTIIELLDDDDVEIGDRMFWDGKPLGEELISNGRNKSTFHVCFQNHEVSQHQLEQQLLLP